MNESINSSSDSYEDRNDLIYAIDQTIDETEKNIKQLLSRHDEIVSIIHRLRRKLDDVYYELNQNQETLGNI